jgi:colanic acid/amylovoran biosynthesis glycosyltransferase
MTSTQLPRSSRGWARRYQRLQSEVDLVFCEGPHVRERMLELGFAADKLCVNHLGVPLQGLCYRSPAWHPGEVLRVLMAASFREKKGISFGIAALAELANQVPLELTLIGDAAADTEGRREKARILAALDHPALKGCVRLLGYRPHARLLEEAVSHHLFLQPSVVASNGDTEGGAPVSLIEMQALGVPVVATRHCDIPNVLAAPYRGFLARERDSADLLLQLQRFLDRAREWPGYAQEARGYIEREFDLERQTRRQLAAYRGLLSQGSPSEDT